MSVTVEDVTVSPSSSARNLGILHDNGLFCAPNITAVAQSCRFALYNSWSNSWGLYWSADLPPPRVHLFPPRLLSENEAAMCQPLLEVGGGVNDLHCCATHSQGVLKLRNS